MHKPPRAVRIAVVSLVLLGLAAAGIWLWTGTPRQALDGRLSASGTIEADETAVSFEVGGRVSQLLTDEGSAVTRASVMAKLDDTLLSAQIAEAETGIATARANLARVSAGVRAEELLTASATVSQAVAARDGAKRAWDTTITVRDRAQDLNARLDAARTQADAAASQVNQARAALASARVQRDHYPDQVAYSHLVRAAEEAVLVAQAGAVKAEAQLSSLLDVRDHPLAAQAQVDSAEAAYHVSVAAVEVAQARLDSLRVGPTREELAVAQATVAQAQAVLNVLMVQHEKRTLVSPLDGLVTGRAASVGELVAPGVTVLTIADLARVYLKVFVEEDKVGWIRLGQPVQVSVDTFPGRVFEGAVTYISPKAEFTPRNVQTQRERVNTVFAVKIRLANSDLALKPGMPADAQFGR